MTRFDFDYIERWAARIGAAELWHTLLDEYRHRTSEQNKPE